MSTAINTYLTIIGAPRGLSDGMRTLARMRATGQAVIVSGGKESSDLLLTQCNGIDVQDAVKAIAESAMKLPDFVDYKTEKEREPWRWPWPDRRPSKLNKWTPRPISPRTGKPQLRQVGCAFPSGRERLNQNAPMARQARLSGCLVMEFEQTCS